MFLGLAGLVASGTALYLIPPQASSALGLAVRSHTAAAWLFAVSLAVHIIVGSGLLPSHRGIARAMFGDGSVRRPLAIKLWPAWVKRQEHE